MNKFDLKKKQNPPVCANKVEIVIFQEKIDIRNLAMTGSHHLNNQQK